MDCQKQDTKYAQFSFPLKGNCLQIWFIILFCDLSWSILIHVLKPVVLTIQAYFKVKHISFLLFIQMQNTMQDIGGQSKFALQLYCYTFIFHKWWSATRITTAALSWELDWSYTAVFALRSFWNCSSLNHSKGQAFDWIKLTTISYLPILKNVYL